MYLVVFNYLWQEFIRRKVKPLADKLGWENKPDDKHIQKWVNEPMMFCHWREKNELVLLYSSETYLCSFVSSDTFEVQFYDQPAVQGTRIALEMQLRFLTNGEQGKGKHFVIRISVHSFIFKENSG